MMLTKFFEDMPYEEMDLIKEKYSWVIEDVKESFKDYADVHPSAACIEIEWTWDDYNIKINAQSKQICDDKYKIIINAFNVVYLEKIFNEREVCENDKVQSISAILSFTAWHEISHILYGHCTIPDSMSEDISNGEKRCMETMCDLNAAFCFMNNMFVDLEMNKSEVDEIIERYAMLFSVLFIYFKELEGIQNIGEIIYIPEKPVCSDGRDHLFSTLRFELVCCVIENSIRKYHKLSDDEIDEIYEKSIYWIEELGCNEPLSINPYYIENNTNMVNTIPDGTEWLKKYVRKIYIE